jgi:sugar lactone lactonase YvrE
VIVTFAKYNKKENIFEPWPSIEMNQRYLSGDSSGLNSILGFEIDKDDNLYILDQGRIKKNPALENSTKLLNYSLKDGQLKREYIFNSDIADPSNSFLNDVVIDKKNKLAYITDSGNSISESISDYKPGIIVLQLEDDKQYKLLTNHHSVFPDQSFWLHIEKEPVINKTNPMMTGVDGIALSCDGEALYYCPLSGRMLYSILTKDIHNAIEKNQLNNITVYEGFKKEASDGLLASSKGYLYMTGIETGSIYISNSIEQDLLRFNYKDFDSFQGNITTMWPDTLAIHDGYLYFVSNQLNNFPHNIDYKNPKNGKYNFAILRFSVINDDSYIKGCTGFGNGLGISSIIIWICFAVIILIVLSFVLMGSNNQEEVIDKHMNLGLKDD